MVAVPTRAVEKAQPCIAPVGQEVELVIDRSPWEAGVAREQEGKV